MQCSGSSVIIVARNVSQMKNVQNEVESDRPRAVQLLVLQVWQHCLTSH